jgi:hypothetical protein
MSIMNLYKFMSIYELRNFEKPNNLFKHQILMHPT